MSARGPIGVPDWLDVGNLCSVGDWDKTEPPSKKIGSPARILEIQDDAGHSQTGIMVLVRGEATGLEVNLDSAWLKPMDSELPLCGPMTGLEDNAERRTSNAQSRIGEPLNTADGAIDHEHQPPPGYGLAGEHEHEQEAKP